MPRPIAAEKPWAMNCGAKALAHAFSPRGSALLYVIASIALLGALGGGVAYFSSSSSMSQVSTTRATQAYYAALSGQKYSKARQTEFEDAKSSLDDFIADLGTDSRLYTLDTTRTFTLSAVKDDATHYSVKIVGEFLDAQGDATENASITLANQEYVVATETAKYAKGGKTVYIAGYEEGDTIGDSVTINSGSIVIGNITSISLTKALGLAGGVIWSGDQLCSNDGVEISGGSIINGDIQAHGNVVITSSVVNGDIYAKGNVTIDGGGIVFGDIHSQGSVMLNNGSIWGDVYVKGVFSKCGWCIFSGDQYSNPTAPEDCAGFALPAHEEISSSTELYITNQYTFTGKTDINDKTYAYKSLKSDGWAEICFDLSVDGSYINIFVSEDMVFNGSIYVKTKPGSCFTLLNYMSGLLFLKSEYAERVYVDVRGSATLGGGTNWFGTIYAKGNIYPGGGSSIIGGLYSSDGDVNPNNSWYYFKHVHSLYLDSRMQ
ncbi:MAG: hypothetical protein ACOY4F_10815 [Thermodesulfobacteriota bacterium]